MSLGRAMRSAWPIRCRGASQPQPEATPAAMSMQMHSTWTLRAKRTRDGCMANLLKTQCR
jgi:hypothetical protein